MEKLNGVKVADWEIVDHNSNREEGYEYEEVSVSELLNKVKMSDAQKDDWGRKYFAINIHIMVSVQTLPFVMEVIKDRMTDPRLAKMNAIVFLGVKPKGRAKGTYDPLPADKYAMIVKLCLALNIPFGFDSCSAPRFEKAVDNMNIKPELKSELKMMSESCESSLFSSYINTLGEYWHCSFSEENENVDSVNVLEANDFLKDVWHNPVVKDFRDKTISSACNGCRECVVYPEINV